MTRRRWLLPLVVCVGIWGGRDAAADTLTGAEIAAHLASSSSLLAMRQAAALPTLTTKEFSYLADNKGVLKEERRDGDPLIRATYFRVVDVAAWRLWLALADSDQHEDFMPYIEESAVLESGGGTKLAYQYMDLPAGIRDRHWIIRSWDNGGLWNSSQRKIWETYWSMEPDSEDLVGAYMEEGLIDKVTAEQVEQALFTPKNEGYWLLVELPDDRCLVAYQAVSDIGGNIPTWLVNELGPSGLKKLVGVIEERGRGIETQFKEGRPPPPAPDGGVIEQLQ